MQEIEPQPDQAPARPYRYIRRERLDELIREAGGRKALERLTGTPDTHFTAISKGRREVGDELATSLEQKMGRPFGWMDTDPKRLTLFDCSGAESELVRLFRLLGERSGREAQEQLLAALHRRVEAANDSRPAPLDERGDPREALIITPQYLGPPRRGTREESRPPPQGDRRTGK